jgi:hypothetical protein
MATYQPELYSSGSVPAKPHFEARVVKVRVVDYGSVNSLDTPTAVLKQFHPLAISSSTGQWIPYDNTTPANNSEIIRGFLYDEEVTIDAAEDTLVNVILEGEIPYELIAALGTGDDTPNGYIDGTLADLKAALRVLRDSAQPLYIEDIPA